MFSERFDALMNIAEVSNSLLGRDVNMNPSYIGRLRSGARPLPKRHEYLAAMCRYLTGHIQKEYQINALQKLTCIPNSALTSKDSAAQYLEKWLEEQEQAASSATKRLIYGFCHTNSESPCASPDALPAEAPQKDAIYLYGNAGKRRAVEQFFTRILQEERTQTLLLFSDEDMAWLYEDAAFAARWTELFTKVILRGNRVRIIHTLSRDMNEMLEAVTKWIPIYMTGMIEPYCYPRIRDGIFRRTLFIAPDTAAVASSSVQQNTDGMLNLFLTDKAALDALSAEYAHYFALCRPLMRIYTSRDADTVQKAADELCAAEGNAYLCSTMPPLFTMPEETVRELSVQCGNDELSIQWERSRSAFEGLIQKQELTLVLSEPRRVLLNPDALYIPMSTLFSAPDLPYTKEQYRKHIEQLLRMEKQYENLRICFANGLCPHTMLYIKESTGVIMVKSDAPQNVFVINDKNMIGAFWDYIAKCVLG